MREKEAQAVPEVDCKEVQTDEDFSGVPQQGLNPVSEGSTQDLSNNLGANTSQPYLDSQGPHGRQSINLKQNKMGRIQSAAIGKI